jgi:NodT family efflux transporter outer membrane factor (OMF) lipoprotein
MSTVLRSRAAALALLLALAGCSSLTHTDYAAPALPTKAAWQAPVDRVQAMPVGNWWSQFRDPGLDTLVDRVLTGNNDLAVAGIRLRQARLSARLAGSQLWPTFGGSAGAGYNARLTGAADPSRSSSTSLNVSWEADLFGRLGAERDAATWEALATAQDLAATQLSLIGTTATLYWQLGYANERIVLGQQSIVYARRALELVQTQYGAGAVSRLELRDAEQSVESQEAAQTQLIQARTETRSALAALLGQQGYDGPEPTSLPRAALPAIPAGLPASLLARRPDLNAGELRLRRTLASADATRASFYPDLSLTGALGTASNTLLGLVGNPAAALSAGLSLPFLNIERVNLSTGIADAEYEAAVAAFRQSFYNALRDVEIALSARTQVAAQGERLERSYAAASDAERLYERQYRAGAIPLRSWLDAQERRRNAESALTDNRFNRLGNQIVLYQALGGDAALIP